MIINCIAVDDEPLALDKISEYIKRIGYLKLLRSFDNGAEALSFLKTRNVDLIFLDIQMDILSGIELIESLKNKPKIILTTAYDTYAIKAFELDVADYLLKPISFPRFLKATEKIYESFISENKAITEKRELHAETIEDFFFVKSGSETIKLNFEDIQYIEGLKDYVSVYTISEKVVILTSFKKLEEILPESKFIRIHKSYIVAVKYIKKIESNQVFTADKHIPIGHTYKKRFLAMINNKKLFQ